jgi:hypothetical protein
MRNNNRNLQNFTGILLGLLVAAFIENTLGGLITGVFLGILLHDNF